MNLIVDIGNTRVKYAVMEGLKVVAESATDSFDAEVARALAETHAVRDAVVASTRGDEARVAALLREAGLEVLCFDAACEVPLSSSYLTPHTLGRDRLAAAVGADALYPGRPMLVVDFGTAITCDYIADHTFHGGFISPGMQMRFRALHEFTARLPRVTPHDEEVVCGRTTESCIEGGVMQGVRYEIEGHIARFRQKNADLLVIFTGGDAKHFAKQIKNTIFADRDLVFLGLNRILEHHISCR